MFLIPCSWLWRLGLVGPETLETSREIYWVCFVFCLFSLLVTGVPNCVCRSVVEPSLASGIRRPGQPITNTLGFRPFCWVVSIQKVHLDYKIYIFKRCMELHRYTINLTCELMDKEEKHQWIAHGNLQLLCISKDWVFFFIKFFFKMYLFLVALGLRCCERPFSSCGAWELFSSRVKWGLISSCDVQISHCGGFSCWGAWVLGTQASIAAGHGLSCSKTCGVFPDQWWNPCLLDW